MVKRKPAVPDPYAGEWATNKHLARPLPPPMRTTDVQKQLNLARADLREGRVAEAAAAAGELLAEIERKLLLPNPKEHLLHALAGAASTLLGLAGSGQDRFQEAIEEFARAGEVVEERGDLAADLGIALAKSGAPDEARPRLETAIDLGEDTPDVRRTLAEVLRDIGRPFDALRAFDLVLERAPYDWRARVARAELAEANGGAPLDVARGWLDAANTLLTAGRPEESAAAAERARELAPALTTDVALALASAHADSGNTAQALAQLHTVRESTATTAQRLSAAELFAQLGAFTEAGELTDAVLAVEPDEPEGLTLRAQLLVNQGRSADAEPIITQLADLAPEDPRTHYLRGVAALDAGDAVTAIAALSRADQIMPGQPAVLANLGAALAHTKHFDTALDLLDQALDLAPDDAWTLILRGRTKMDLERLAEAEADIRAALSFEPDQAEGHALLGELLSRKEDYAEADTEFALALTLDPGLGWVWPKRGEALTGLARWAEARDAFETAIRLAPEDASARTGLVNVLLSANGPDTIGDAERVVVAAIALDGQAADARALHAEILRRQGKLDEALAELDRALELLPDYAYAVGTRGEVLLELGRRDEAITELRRSVELGLDPAWVHGQLGQAHLLNYAENGTKTDLDQSLAHLRQAVTAVPDSPSLHVDLGQALRQQEDNEDALAEFDQALALYAVTTDAVPTSDLATAYACRGETRLALGDAAGAVADLDRAHDLGEDAADIRALSAEAKRLTDDLAGALTDADAALAEDPENVLALTVRGAVHADRGSPEAAEADLRAALRHDPVNADAHRQLRLLLLSAKRYDESVEALADAVGRTTGDVSLLSEYAQALTAAGDVRLALTVLDELLWRAPGNPEVHRLLGDTLSGTGRYAEAVSAYAQGLSLAPGDNTLVLNLAYAQARNDEFDAALATLDRLPPDATTLTARAEVFLEMGRWADAAAAASEAVRLPGHDVSAYLALGWALQHGEHTDQAKSKEAYAQAMRLSPEDDPWPRKGFANACYLTDDEETAHAHYRYVAKMLTDVSAHDPDRNGLRGWCLYRMGRHAEAVDCLRRAVDEPDLRPGILLDLVLAHLGRGDFAAAEDALAAVVTELDRLAPPRRRGIAQVGLDNLRTAAEHDVADRQKAREFVARITEALDAEPQA
ncbi:tetratricopeptide repeat protein [Amycolatopsis sp. CA-230715]|uniref:tetratricopeptide repeat protein n=1 Tax=Amycolatopsis sp. CA-230715 TaxID=2745196 RepID=UPI001C026226|nr:tetratricopeptide repeat protein [Amycolatopsis sp. CA-230715]QWF84068.1 Beta-barrel assembly-enhancing protease [Amycolatopsis sp. CA-230715]